MESFKHKWVEIQGYKHNGSLHRIWDKVFIIEETPSFIIGASFKTKVVEHNFRMWYTKEPALMILFKDKWMNVIAMLKKQGITYYINLASPFIKDKGKIKYIDYDLDYKLYPNGTIKLIDVKEYGYHRKMYGYNEDIDNILKYNIKKIRTMMEDKEFPFQDEIILKYYNEFKELTKNEEYANKID